MTKRVYYAIIVALALSRCGCRAVGEGIANLLDLDDNGDELETRMDENRDAKEIREAREKKRAQYP
jgi:hypothetical protein